MYDRGLRDKRGEGEDTGKRQNVLGSDDDVEGRKTNMTASGIGI